MSARTRVVEAAALACVLAGCSSASSEPQPANAPSLPTARATPPGTPTAAPTPVRIGLPPARSFPMKVVDLAETDVVHPEVTNALHAGPRLPWVRTVGPSGRYRAVMRWRGREVELKANESLDVVTAKGVLVSLVHPQSGGDRLFVDWDGNHRRVVGARQPAWFNTARVGDRVWMSVRSRGSDELAWWRPGTYAVHRVPLPPEATLADPDDDDWGLRLSVLGALGRDDVIYEAGWEKPSGTYKDLGLRRTSGKPAGWDLREVTAVSRSGQLVAGPPRQTGSRPGCLALYRAAARTPEWTRCYVRSARNKAVRVVGFTHGGRRLLVLVEGGRWVSPADMFHRGDNTLLVLDTRDGSVSSRFDWNFFPVLEDDRHILYVDNLEPIEIRSTDEGSYVSWIMRCTIAGPGAGRCERATGPLANDTFGGAVGALARP